MNEHAVESSAGKHGTEQQLNYMTHTTMQQTQKLQNKDGVDISMHLLK